MAIGSYKTNPFLQQVLFQNLSSASVQPDQLKDSTRLLNSAMQARSSVATISSGGAKLNNISSAIRGSGDMQAYEGFQTAMKQASSSDPLKMMRFVNSADFAAKNDATALGSSFASLARSTGDKDAAVVDGFNSAFVSTVEKTGTAGLTAFNKAFSAVEKADYSGSDVSLGDNLKKLFSTVNEVNAASGSSKENVSNLERLAKGAELNKNADDIWTYFDEFVGYEPKKTA